MSKERITTWFLEPIGGYSNELIVKALNELSEEALSFGIECCDGKVHSLVSCSHGFKAKVEESRQTDRNLKFRVWTREGNGPIRLWKGFAGGKKKMKRCIPSHWKATPA